MGAGTVLEQVVAAVESALASAPGTRIERDVKVVDRDGVTQQIDVLVTVPTGGGRNLRIALECRNHASRVKKEAIHAFKKKREESRIDKAAMVARTGYQSGAVTKAKALGVELLTLREFDASRAHGLLRLSAIDVRTHRFRITDIEILAPTLPDSALEKKCVVVDNLWHKLLPLDEWVVEIVNSEPPPFATFQDGLKLWRTLSFRVGDIELKWEGASHPLKQLRIATEFYVDESKATIALAGNYADVESNDRANVVTYKVPGDEHDVALSFIETKSGSLTAIAEMPVEFSGNINPARKERLTQLFKDLKFEVQHEYIAPDSPQMSDITAQRIKYPRVLSAKISTRTHGHKDGRVPFDRIILSDRRTTYGTGEFMLELLMRSTLPITDLRPGLLRRIRTVVNFPQGTCFLDSQRGLLDIEMMNLEIDYASSKCNAAACIQ